MKYLFWLIILAVVFGLAFIRFAPSNPERWHVDPQVTADQDLASGVRRRIAGGEDRMAALERIILSTPRTERLAGSVEDGRATYVSRSKWFGFPDYTTVQRGDDGIEIWGRQRFGQADAGVNRRRVEGWLTTLGPEA